MNMQRALRHASLITPRRRRCALVLGPIWGVWSSKGVLFVCVFEPPLVRMLLYVSPTNEDLLTSALHRSSRMAFSRKPLGSKPRKDWFWFDFCPFHFALHLERM